MEVWLGPVRAARVVFLGLIQVALPPPLSWRALRLGWIRAVRDTPGALLSLHLPLHSSREVWLRLVRAARVVLLGLIQVALPPQWRALRLWLV